MLMIRESKKYRNNGFLKLAQSYYLKP